MDYKAEQAEEIAVLASIYPDELTQISDTELEILLSLDTPASKQRSLILHVKYPETYPEVIPELSVRVPSDEELGLSDDEETSDEEAEESDAAKILSLADTIQIEDKDIADLESRITETAEECLGMASVFTVASVLKEEAEQRFQEKLDRAEKLHEAEVLKKEMEEQKKFQGTPVTRESYLQWRENFRRETGYYERKAAKEKLRGSKLSGRQIFEQGLAKADGDLEDERETLPEVGKLEISA